MWPRKWGGPEKKSGGLVASRIFTRVMVTTYQLLKYSVL
jgi:hypothetical protein